MHDVANPWDRLAAEKTDAAWSAFVAYRDMPLPRSLAKLGQHLGCSKQNLENWSSRNRWVDRCRAWDAAQDRITQEAIENELKQLARRNVKLIGAAQGKVAAKLAKITDNDISPGKLPQWIRALSEAERIARGAPAYRVEVTGKDGGAIEFQRQMSEAEQQLADILGAVLEQAPAGSVAEESDE